MSICPVFATTVPGAGSLFAALDAALGEVLGCAALPVAPGADWAEALEPAAGEVGLFESAIAPRFAPLPVAFPDAALASDNPMD
jgi:hypothetical protein